LGWPPACCIWQCPSCFWFRCCQWMILHGCNANDFDMHVLLLIAHLCCACLTATICLASGPNISWCTKVLLVSARFCNENQPSTICVHLIDHSAVTGKHDTIRTLISSFVHCVTQVVCKMNHPLPSIVLCGLHQRLRQKQLPTAALQQRLRGRCQLDQRAQQA